MNTTIRHRRVNLGKALLVLCILWLGVIDLGVIEARTKSSSPNALEAADFDAYPLTKEDRRLMRKVLNHRLAVQKIMTGDRIWPAAVFDRHKKMFADVARDDELILWRLIHSERIVRDPGIEPIDVIKSSTSTSRWLDQIPNDPSAFFVEVETVDEFHQRSNQLFQHGHYQEVFPHLLASAKYGYRNSQSQLAFILFQELEGLPRDEVRAFAWLGTAASTSTPKLALLYNELRDLLDDEHKRVVDDVVRVYRKRFGVNRHFDCDAQNLDSRSLKKIYCHLQLDSVIKNCGKPCVF